MSTYVHLCSPMYTYAIKDSIEYLSNIFHELLELKGMKKYHVILSKTNFKIFISLYYSMLLYAILCNSMLYIFVVKRTPVVFVLYYTRAYLQRRGNR